MIPDSILLALLALSILATCISWGRTKEDHK